MDLRAARESLRSEGFVVLKRVLAQECFEELYRTIVSQFRKHYPELGDSPDAKRPWETQEFHDFIIRARREERDRFSDVYDCTVNSAALYRLMTSREVIGAAAGLLETDPIQLSLTGVMARMDSPRDSRNSITWHQDRPYYPECEELTNGLVCWIPLQEVEEANGSLRVLPGSHCDGVIPMEEGQGEQGGSRQLRIPDEQLAHFAPETLSANLGDVAFLSMYLVHSSGENRSDRVRFTAGARYHRMDALYLPPAKCTFTPNRRYRGHRVDSY